MKTLEDRIPGGRGLGTETLERTMQYQQNLMLTHSAQAFQVSSVLCSVCIKLILNRTRPVNKPAHHDSSVELSFLRLEHKYIVLKSCSNFELGNNIIVFVRLKLKINVELQSSAYLAYL